MADNEGGGRSLSDEALQVASSRDPTGRLQPDGAPFHSQLEHLSNNPSTSPQHAGAYVAQQPFDMDGMAAALPRTHQISMNVPMQYPRNDMIGMVPGPYQMQQTQQFQPGRHYHFDPAAVRMPTQQFVAHPYTQPSPTAQRSPVSPHVPAHFNQIDPYGYGMGSMPMHPVDPRFAGQPPYNHYAGMANEMSPYMRRGSEPAAIPSFPRGPPRKPKQSGHALWVGNLPPAASVSDLKDHFSRDATKDIESLFLISKSNCAFVNYRTEAACIAAMNRFHDSRFNGVRLVCRLRRGTNTATSPTVGSNAAQPAAAGETALNNSTHTTSESPAAASVPSSVVSEDRNSPTIVGTSTTESGSRAADAAGDIDGADRVTERFFIVKSLTVQDLESSVRNGVWATQAHNEAALNRAFAEADIVYLLFSANKSGEYFGYAKMTSKISGEPVHLGSSNTQDEVTATATQGAPQSIPTPATATAPKGRIIDDSARGTIFWEAEHSDSELEESTSPVKSNAADQHDGQNWGRQFSIEWLSTARLPFYRTRGLRNPLNDNREVKIARDGTELDPSVGRRLIQMFPRPPPAIPQSAVVNGMQTIGQYR